MRLVKFGLALAAILLLFGWLQFQTQAICCGDFDGYYHIKWSRMIWDGLAHGHLHPSFTSLPLTTLNVHDYADQHYLFHLLLVPFSWLSNLALGAKLYAALLGSLAMFSCYWLLVRYRIRWPALWLLALLSSSSMFLYRMSMTRAQSLSILFIVAGIVLLFERKYAWLALAAFLYVWSYNLFVILAAMALIWAELAWLEKAFEWRPLLWTFAGIIAGFVIHPYFPHNISLFVEHVTDKGTQLAQGVGMEWYSLSSWLLLRSSFVAFAAMVLGCIVFGFLVATGNRGKLRRPLFFLLLATLLLVLTARSKRFTEYWPPMAILFAAFTMQAVWETQVPARRQSPRRLPVLMVAVLLAVALGYEVVQAKELVGAPVDPDQYRAGAQWLLKNVPAGQIIFNVAWDDFPKLFYYDNIHSYVAGLDPQYLSDQNPELGRIYERIAAGQQDHPGVHIRKDFGAQYVFLSASVPRNFYVTAMLSGEFEKVYQDSQCTILKVRDSML
jgi:hypothetical protein